jgi:hypothetical protein
VEEYFLNFGALVRNFHTAYWNGLNSSTSTWPKFNWLDSTVPPPGDNNYVHWARGQPDNEVAPETCGVCNASAAYGGAWGWGDSSCYRCGPPGDAWKAGAAAAWLLEHVVYRAAAARLGSKHMPTYLPTRPPRSALPYICKTNKPGVFSFTDKDTKITYTLNTTADTRVNAQKAGSPC